MLFQKKERSEKSLYPVLHVAGSLQEYRQELVRGEVAALRELNRAAEAFREAQGEQERLQQSLRAFDQTFLEMRQMAIELAAVREEVSLSVAQARREMELLWGGAGRLEEDMDRLRGGAGALSRSVEQAGQDAGALSEAARQASELAVETALRAARSEEEGFAQGLSELEGLVKEAQRLSDALGKGLEAVDREGEALRTGVGGAVQVLEESACRAEQAQRVLEKLARTSERVSSAQSALIGLVRRSESAYQVLCGAAKKLKTRCQEAARYVDRAGCLGTMQSAVFEDMENMLAQLVPLVNEYDP